MITKSITFAMDENTGVAIYMGKLVQFIGDDFHCVTPEDALTIYEGKAVKVPPEFPVVREALQAKMTALGALL